jgi:hypothetical protein
MTFPFLRMFLPSQQPMGGEIDKCQPMREEKTVERVSVNISSIRK